MRCDLDRASIDYDTFGEGIPLVVIHGMPLDRAASIFEFEPILSTRPGWQRIYLDLPGHGKSPAATSITTPDELLAVLAEFVDALLSGARFVLAGTSYGGYLARGLVHEMGSRIDGLCLNVPLIFRDAERTRAPRAVIADRAGIATRSRQPGWGWYGLMAVADPEENRDYAAAVNRSTADTAYLDKLHGRATPCSFETKELAGPFVAPTLIMTGRQDSVVGFQGAFEVLSSYPRATLAVLDRAGHLLRGEQPTLFRTLLDEWLDRVEEWIGHPGSPPDGR
jgi:pimeloyl-ACP methyl ester carboxylesterase